MQILAKLSEMQDAEQFDIREFVTQGETVIALGHYRWRKKSNGQFYESDWAHAFGTRKGKISSFQVGTRTLGLPHVTGFKPVLVSRVGRATNHNARRTGVKGSGTRCYARYRDIADRYL